MTINLAGVGVILMAGAVSMTGGLPPNGPGSPVQRVQSGGSARLTGAPLQGAAPLTVTFTGASSAIYFGGIQIDFGDGEQAALCLPGGPCADARVTHTYQAPGSYAVRMLGNGEGPTGPKAIATLTVVAK